MTTAFVIGYPIGHSKSPLIHGTWLDELDIDGRFVAIELAPDALPGFIARVRGGEFIGGNVTIPHKEKVMGLLDGIEPLAQKIGAVNTIVRDGDRLIGRNTDYLGFLANLDAGAPGWDRKIEKAIVLGAGGAARAILAGLIDRGVETIHVLNRTPARAQALAQDFGEEGGTLVHPGALDDFSALSPGARLVVNTSSVGLGGTRFENIVLDGLDPGAVVTDIVYNPLITPLLEDAARKGFRIVDGLGMLLHQAVPGFEAWFGVRPEVTRALREKIAAGETGKGV